MTLHKRYDAALKRWVTAEKRIEAAEEKIFSAFLERTSAAKAKHEAPAPASAGKVSAANQPQRK